MSGSYVSGTGRMQLMLLPDMIEDYVGEKILKDSSTLSLTAFDLHDLGFKHSVPENGLEVLHTIHKMC